MKVRTAQRAEGWTDTRQLLTNAQMDGLKQMAESATHYPSYGTATVYETLNVHMEANRASPSFWQIPENGKVDVIGHKLAPRTQREESGPEPVKPAPIRRKPKTRGSQARRVSPPRPPAPKPPGNWLALSVPNRQSIEQVQPETVKPSPAHAVPVPMDDWSMVRSSDGKVGWVLTRPLSMSIPDEVAQYAEGHRITSYFALGQTRDRDAVKNNWLWTTITRGQAPYEFDSFRVFVWSLKHHRYETAYIERNVVGHFPVQVDTAGSAPHFSLVVEGNDGNLYRKTYSFESLRIRMVSRLQYQETPQEMPKGAGLGASQVQTRSWFARVKDAVRWLFR